MSNITKDDYEIWLNNDVTKRFLFEIKAYLDDCKSERIIGDHEQMIRMAHERNEAMHIYEYVLAWKPEELFKDEESK